MPSPSYSKTLPAEALPKAVRPRTPGLLLGPFYPVHLAMERQSTEKHRAGAPSTGERRLELFGCVLDTYARPLAGARIELWHADPQGRYRHPSQPGVEEIGSDFAGYEVLTTRAEGNWHSTTEIPGPYSHDGVSRAPHLHFQVTYRHLRLVTQMFFPDQPLNATDRWYCAVRKRALLVGRRRSDEPACLALEWDIVLAG